MKTADGNVVSYGLGLYNGFWSFWARHLRIPVNIVIQILGELNQVSK